MCVGHTDVGERAMRVNGPQQNNQAHVITVQERDATPEILHRMTGNQREALTFEDHSTSVRLKSRSPLVFTMVACFKGRESQR